MASYQAKARQIGRHIGASAFGAKLPRDLTIRFAAWAAAALHEDPYSNSAATSSREATSAARDTYDYLLITEADKRGGPHYRIHARNDALAHAQLAATAHKFHVKVAWLIQQQQAREDAA